MEPTVPDCSAKGNTIPSRGNPCKKLCFTWNNYPTGAKDLLINTFNKFSNKYIFQTEIGENGTKHIQGAIINNKKIRWTAYELPNSIHWEPGKGTETQMFEYCCKNDTYDPNGYRYIIGYTIPKPIKIIETLWAWQSELYNIYNSEPDDRSIYWIYNEEGNIGKSQFCKYLCVKHPEECIILCGGAADMKYGIVEYHKKYKNFPKCIITDLPRNITVPDFSGIEEIKNGMFFSPKYESTMIVGNSPHIFIFSNYEPKKSKLSIDRWKIGNITEKKNINWES